MSLTPSEARDEMFSLFSVAWATDAPAIAGYAPEVRWQGKEEPAAPDASKFWVRVSTQHVFEEQKSLTTEVTGQGKRRYEVSGLIFVQLFCPKSNPRATEQGYLLAQVARAAFRGKSTPGNVWFYNVRINELPEEDQFYRFNIIGEYEYDEIG